MQLSERTFLLGSSRNSYSSDTQNVGLNLFYAVVCIVDVFGVFPIITLSKPVIDCGYAGIVVILGVCSLQIYTSSLLGKCWLMAEQIEPEIKFKNRHPFSALAELTYGSAASNISSFLLDMTVFCSGIPNLVVASRNLQLLGIMLTENKFDMSFCYWMIIIGTIMCPFLWLRSPKDMRYICLFSVCLVISVFGLTMFAIYGNNSVVPSIPTTPTDTILWHKILTAYGILVFQLDIHPTILTIQVDMKNKSKIFPSIIIGFLITLTLFLSTCLTLAHRFGSQNIQPSILEMLSPSISLYVITVLVALQLILSSAISHTSLYQHLDDLMGIPREINYKRCIVRSLMTFLSILVAESVPRFDLVMALIGGALTGPLVFIFPPLFYIKMLQLKKIHEDTMLVMESLENVIFNADNRPLEYPELDLPFDDENEFVIKGSRPKSCGEICCTNMEFCFCLLIICFGVLATIATTSLNIINTIRFVTFSPPCIYKIVNATL